MAYCSYCGQYSIYPSKYCLWCEEEYCASCFIVDTDIHLTTMEEGKELDDIEYADKILGKRIADRLK